MVGNNGAVQMQEEDGLDYAAVTVRLPGAPQQAIGLTLCSHLCTGASAKRARMVRLPTNASATSPNISPCNPSSSPYEVYIVITHILRTIMTWVGTCSCGHTTGGEPVPMMFTIKGVNAVGTLAKFEGTFTVPSYRGSSFMDPRVSLCACNKMWSSTPHACMHACHTWFQSRWLNLNLDCGQHNL